MPTPPDVHALAADAAILDKHLERRPILWLGHGASTDAG